MEGLQARMLWHELKDKACVIAFCAIEAISNQLSSENVRCSIKNELVSAINAVLVMSSLLSAAINSIEEQEFEIKI